MIRKEFEKGGFPLCSIAPILCIDENFALYVAYNRYDLIKILKTQKIKVCYGIWPGKWTSDCFIIDPQAYINIPIPPEEHKEIDNSKDIIVDLTKDGIFVKIQYLPRKPDAVWIESKDENLYSFIKNSNIKFRVNLVND